MANHKKNRPLFDTTHQQKIFEAPAVPRVGARAKPGTRIVGGAPKKLTKGLKKHLRKVLEQNPTECQRQLRLLGLSEDCYKELGLE